MKNLILKIRGMPLCPMEAKPESGHHQEGQSGETNCGTIFFFFILFIYQFTHKVIHLINYFLLSFLSQQRCLQKHC